MPLDTSTSLCFVSQNCFLTELSAPSYSKICVNVQKPESGETVQTPCPKLPTTLRFVEKMRFNTPFEGRYCRFPRRDADACAVEQNWELTDDVGHTFRCSNVTIHTGLSELPAEAGETGMSARYPRCFVVVRQEVTSGGSHGVGRAKGWGRKTSSIPCMTPHDDRFAASRIAFSHRAGSNTPDDEQRRRT